MESQYVPGVEVVWEAVVERLVGEWEHGDWWVAPRVCRAIEPLGAVAATARTAMRAL